MKMIRFEFWFVFILVVAVVMEEMASHLLSGPHIADVNVLLPPKMTNPVEFRLQGSDGCFKWSWDHHDILSVTPEYNMSSHCSTSARLRSVAPYSGRKETAVYATDVRTGVVIRCKVFIDNFSRIQIFHNSIKLDLDGLATLRVRAFDSEENEFSSLVGLQFMWQLMPETDELSHHLAHVPLKDSPLSDCGGLCGYLDIRIKLEDSGLFSDLYVVKGIGIGHEKVLVRLLEPLLTHMSDKIALTVVEAMSLAPLSPLFVLIGAGLRYTLKVIRGNTPQVVYLPSPHHRWSVSNSSVAEVNSLNGFTHALNLGVTNVIVEDTRVSGHIQMSSLNVVLPDSLVLYLSHLSSISDDSLEGTKDISSGARWYIVSGREYIIQMKVFSREPDAQEIYITESDDIKLYDQQSDNWKTSLVTEQIAQKYGSLNTRILKSTSPGLGKLTASLTYFSGHLNSKEVLKVAQEVMVCEEVKFSLDKTSGPPQKILLPWLPNVYQEMELKASGGCAKTSSDYKWFSSDVATVSVSAFGVVQAKKPGNATLKVVSIFDSSNYDEVTIEVSTLFSMIMLQNFPVETAVGSYLEAAVTLKAPNGAYFSRCDAFSLLVKWKAGSESFVLVNATREMSALDYLQNIEFPKSASGPPCSWTHIYAAGSGRTMLHATLSKEYSHFDSYFSQHVVLKATSIIAAYPPLVLRQAGDGSPFGGYWYDRAQAETDNELKRLDKLYLVPGTQLDVMLLGGPEKWGKNVDFIETVEILDEGNISSKLDEDGALTEGVHVHNFLVSHGRIYSVVCQTLGTYKLVFRRGNLVGNDHPMPAIEETLLSLACSYPSAVVLIVDEPVNKHEVIRTATQADRSPGRIRVNPVTVANGQTIRVAAVGISNSGEPFANSSSLCLSWELSNCDGLAYWDQDYDPKRFVASWERFLVLQNESGLCTVHATVTGFCGTMNIPVYAALPKGSENVLTDTVRLQLVSTLGVNPEFNLLVFNPEAKVNLSITGGSCFLESVVNDSRVVEIIQSPPGLHCLQLVLSPKGLGTALVTVYDIGLVPPLAASAEVQVSNVDWIKILSGDEITIMEGRTESIDIVAGIKDGSTFVSSQYPYMNVCVHIEDDIIELVDPDHSSTPARGYLRAPTFKIVGKHLGVTSLHVSVKQQSGNEILSQPIKVEIYAPPRLHPNHIFLVPGASYALIMEGGPTIGVSVEYAITDDGIATVHKSSGQLSAISPGNTTILATIFGKRDAVICQAYGSVQVGVPTSASLIAQSDMLAIGREMPVFPSFYEDDLFSISELCKSYKWAIEDEKVLNFLVLEDLHDRELGFISVLHGRSAGRTNVTVSFLCEFTSSGSYFESRSYHASMPLLVVPDLPLALGVPITWVLPPFYTTSGVLPSSLETHVETDGQIRKRAISYSVLRNCDEVIRDPISIDGNRIKTKESNNIACIQAKDRASGRVDIASCVRVSEVTQIRITSQEFPFRTIDIAVGAELELPISYCDSLGNPFYEAHDVVHYNAQTNHPDVVSISTSHDGNENIRLKGMQHGKALLRVSINNNLRKADYMMVSVGARVYPRSPVVHIGSRLNFSIEGLDGQVSGHWLSANKSVITVETDSGQSEAVGEGSTQVFFQSNSMKLWTKVKVLSGNIVRVDAPKEMLTNVPPPVKGYNFLVKFSDGKSEAPRNGKAVTYNCQVNPSYVGYAKPWMDDMGNTYCLFFPYSPEHLVRSMPKLKNMKPSVSVSVSVSGLFNEAYHVSGSASALFVGGFSISEIGKLSLTPESNKTIITILGNTDVEIRWHDRDSLAISPIHREDFGIGGRAKYEVKVLRNERFRDKIIITLPANGQRKEIDLSYEPGERAALGTTTNITFWVKMLVSFAVLILTLIILIGLLDRRTYRSQSSNAPAAPSIAAPGTPDRSNPSVITEQSPRTPQPFIDYVRRTVDETPYYRREGRRRINPQNTF